MLFPYLGISNICLDSGFLCSSWHPPSFEPILTLRQINSGVIGLGRRLKLLSVHPDSEDGEGRARQREESSCSFEF